jgi:anti-sigma regulatory factor (Ser/Thr protein kinase)
LIVDDDPGILQMLEATLEAPDRRVEGVCDGLEGLGCVESAAYDLIVTDIDLLERIHKIRPDAKVAVMTRASTPQNILRALREHAFTFFSEPFAIETVHCLLERALVATAWEDDIEVLSASPQWLALRLRCKMEAADRILQFLHEMGSDLPPAERSKMAIAFREVLLNAIEHGGGNDPEKSVFITYRRTGRAILYQVRDPGKGFSFANLPQAALSHPDTPLAHIEIRERMGLRPGGLGLLVTRGSVDEMIYNEAGNEVLLIKYLV